MTPTYCLEHRENTIYIKRDDLLPYSFGGNKARKARLFFEKIKSSDCNCVVTYGSLSSNHCRVISNLACGEGLRCVLISPEEKTEKTYNSELTELFGAQRITVPIERIHDTIEETLASLKKDGFSPFFIPGGGHGNIGTKAYVQCYEEIKQYEKETGVYFDRIFLASGTGTTQAGLICGQLLNGDDRIITGISIARKNPYGRNVVLESVKSYLAALNMEIPEADIEKATVFDDNYIGDGYGAVTSANEISEVIKRFGIPLDPVYTGKAFAGMKNILDKKKITGETVLFIHTGGTPLFFDYLGRNQ